MPAKTIKLATGHTITIESIRLKNGNLLIPGRDPNDRTQATWVEVEPGSSDYKRWLPVSEDKPDPRKSTT